MIQETSVEKILEAETEKLPHAVMNNCNVCNEWKEVNAQLSWSLKNIEWHNGKIKPRVASSNEGIFRETKEIVWKK